MIAGERIDGMKDIKENKDFFIIKASFLDLAGSEFDNDVFHVKSSSEEIPIDQCSRCGPSRASYH